MNPKEITAFANQFTSDTPVVCITGAVYPYLVFPTLLRQALADAGHTIQMLDVSAHEPAAVYAQLEQSFLGQRCFFWLGNLSALPKGSYEQWIGYLGSYKGPHYVGFFSEPTPALKALGQIEFSDRLTAAQAAALFEGHRAFVPRAKVLLKDVYKQCDTLTFDQICLLVQYGRLVGRHHMAFLREWLPKLIVPDQSLFSLSAAFFAKDTKAFYAQWGVMKEQYPDLFWISYWSEQLWRASQYVQCRPDNFTQAKRIGYRLPFSFLNNDWKKGEPTKMRQAHHELYQIDYNLKNGATGPLLDLWYGRWFV